MTVPTLLELIEEVDAKQATFRIVIGGSVLTHWSSLEYQFAIGQVPTARITVPGWQYVTAGVAEEAAVEIYFGYRSGVTELEKLVFGGAVVDSIGTNGPEVVIEAVMDGARKLSYSYNRRIDFDFTAIDATDAVLGLLELAGVTNYAVNLDPWVIGTAVPQTIQFSTYGEAINKISEVDGSPWYCMPSGQIRIENRDPVPSASWHREYFSSILTGSIESQPVDASNADARPRIMDISRREFRNEVANFIEVDGAVVVTLGPNGEQNSNQIQETVDGASGQFPNGAYWIPTPPLFQDFTFANELIDTNAKAFAVAERYFALKNRLFERMPLTVPGDPDVFLGETVKVIDPKYSNISSLYFVEGYRTSVDGNSCVTELSLVGGDEAGTTGFASPFAEFIWKYTALHNLIGGEAYNFGQLDLSFVAATMASIGSKLCLLLTSMTGTVDLGGGLLPGTDKPMVFITFDGTPSDDFDGQIVSYAWADDQGHSGTGPLITIAYDPDLVSSVEMTLTVTDDSGRTDAITKTVFTSADHQNVPGQTDVAQNDTMNGGGVTIGECTDLEIEPNDVSGDGSGSNPEGGTVGPGGCNGLAVGLAVAAGGYAMGSNDGATWNDIDKVTAGVVGDIISVGVAWDFGTGKAISVFGTDFGEWFISEDLCLTSQLMGTLPGNPRIEVIYFDRGAIGGINNDAPDGIDDTGSGTPVTGVLTIEEAYKLCLAAGFAETPAIIAVAIMIGESGLDTQATGVNPGPPASIDRGIAQINNIYHPEVSDACAYDGACAIRQMYRISSGGTDFSPWSVYNNASFIPHLSEVQEALGFDTGALPVTGTDGGVTPIVPMNLRGWLGTSDGRVYISEDSGRTWTLWCDMGDGFPIRSIHQLPIGDGNLALCVSGGDTAFPESLIRIIDVTMPQSFYPFPLGGNLLTAIILAGAGFSCIVARNQTAMAIGFNGGVSPAFWTNTDPAGNIEGWVGAVGGPAAVNTIAPGWGGEFLIA